MSLVDYFRDFFIGRNDAYGFYLDNGEITVKKEEITDDIILKHLKQEITIGSYYAFKINDICYCQYSVIDFDSHELEQIEDIKKKLSLLSYESKIAIMKRYNIPEDCIIREFSGRGYHLWIKFMPLTTLERAYDFREHLREFVLEKLELDEEIFPKQPTIDNGGFGNWVKLPLSINRKNGEFCEILDDFDITKQGIGFKIPNWIPKIDIKQKKITNNTINHHTTINFQNYSKDNNIIKEIVKKQQENKDRPFLWFTNNIRNCLRSIALGIRSTHGLGNDYGHKMNMCLCNNLIYLGAPDHIIHQAFMYQPFYNPTTTQKQIDSLRKGAINHPEIFMRSVHSICDRIKQRGFCNGCRRE